MTSVKYLKLENISLRKNPELSEKWVQDRIADDPSILGLGELILKDKERIQPGAGRLDLLFQDVEENLRYEVEIQLGKTDESHIIRTIEYWDIERRRYPNFDHIAVIVAEDITSRFLNVINLFNGFIPLIAIQMRAYKVEDHVSLLFTTVLDRREIGGLEEEEGPQETTDRAYWEKRGTKITLGMTDEILTLVKNFDPKFELKYNKFYIGISRDGQAFNFVVIKPQKTAIRMELRLERSSEIEEKINLAGLEVLEYSSRNKRYKIRLSKEELHKEVALISELLQEAYNEFSGDNLD